MEIRKLECFLKVCETGSISGASEQLYISQQGISRIISSLEKELGTVLLSAAAREFPDRRWTDSEKICILHLPEQ